MGKLREYRAIIFSGLAVLLFLAAAYLWVESVEKTDSRYTYAEHLFREGSVNEIDIQIAEEDWQDMLENPLAEEFHRANVVINGEMAGNVAIRTKGNTSLTFVASSDSDRYSFKLDFDYFEDNGNYYGLKKLNLNNNYSDSSSMREYISYRILDEMGVPTPGCGYTHLTINGEEWGLYLAVEAIDEVFLATHFEDASGDLYKPDGTGADLVYRGDDISEYTGLNLKTNEGRSDGEKILALMRALESGEGLEETLDVDEALRYLAVNTALANFDSYQGGTTHNYYLYEQDGVFSILPWDYNLSFGGFGGGNVDIYNPVSGMGGPGGERERESDFPAETDGGDWEPIETGKENLQEDSKMLPEMDGRSQPEENQMAPEMGGRSQPEENQTTPGIGESFDSNRRRMEQPEGMEFPGNGGFGGSGEKPLVTTLLANEDYMAAYEGYLKEIAETYLSQEYMSALVTEIHDLIAPYVEKDATAFYSFEEFEQASSIDPEDAHSLVYFSVNMAESILNQLAGGEATFDSGSLKGGGMGFGGGNGGFSPGMRPEQNEGEREAGVPAFGGRGGGRPDGGEGMRNMPGMDSRSNLDTVLPIIALCSGVFAAGMIYALLFRRKKELKPPRE